MLFLRCMFNNSHDVIDLRKNTVVKEQINAEVSLLGATTHKF